jgi:hypothetical protein
MYEPWLISNLKRKILIYLHIIHLLKSSTCFEHYPSHLQVYVVTVYTQPLVSSLFAGDCLVHRLSSFLTMHGQPIIKKCMNHLTHYFNAINILNLVKPHIKEPSRCPLRRPTV